MSIVRTKRSASTLRLMAAASRADPARRREGNENESIHASRGGDGRAGEGVAGDEACEEGVVVLLQLLNLLPVVDHEEQEESEGGAKSVACCAPTPSKNKKRTLADPE
jgi:hypothetical protein